MGRGGLDGWRRFLLVSEADVLEEQPVVRRRGHDPLEVDLVVRERLVELSEAVVAAPDHPLRVADDLLEVERGRLVANALHLAEAGARIRLRPLERLPTPGPQ